MSATGAEPRFLLIRKQRLSSETLAEHVRQLIRWQLDPYQLRLMLNGDGLAVLSRGEMARLQSVGDTLTELGYSWSIVESASSAPESALIRRFEIISDRLVFESAGESWELPKGAAVLAVLASLESDFLGKIIRKSALLGGKTARLSAEEKYHELVHRQAVLDLYILPDPLDLSTVNRLVGLRFLPGKFDPASLGEKATTSARQNMDRLVELIRDYAGSFFLEMDFGLFQIPGCRFDNTMTEEAAEQNLRSVSKYGWYLLRLYARGKPRTKTEGNNAGPLGAILPNQSSAIEPPAEPEPVALPPPPPVYEPKAPLFGLLRREVLLPASVMVAWFLGPAFASLMGDAAMQTLIDWGFRRGILFFMLGAACFYGGFYNLRLKQWVTNTPTSRIRSAAMGMVEVKGRAERAYNVLAPLTQTPCVYYRLRKYRKKHNADRGSQWILTSTQTSGPVPFFLRDESGRAQIDPAGATVRMNQIRDIQGQMTSLWGSPVLLDDETRYVEEILPEGALIYVLGFAIPRREEIKPLHRRLVERLRQVKQDPARVRRFDTNRDGRIDEQEWTAARAEVEREVLEEALAGESSATPAAERMIVGRPPHGGLPFVISQTTEDKLTTNISLWIGACMGGAVLFTVIGLLAILS